MAQTDEKQSVGLSLFFNFFIKFGSLTFFLWWILLAVLSPLWGYYVWDLSDHILSKADYLENNQVLTSPAIDIFRNLSWSHILGVGSLLGFLFYALPLALILALAESIASSFQSNKIKWIIRILSLAWLFSPLGDVLLAFSGSFFMGLLLAILCLGLTIYLSKLLCFIKRHSCDASIKRVLIVSAIILFCVSHFLTHPVLHVAVNSKEYSQIDSMALVRDWLLLNEKGHNWVNSWYYNHTAIAMEKELITTFQPMVVGTIGINQVLWNRKFASFFTSLKGRRGQRIKFLKLSDSDNLRELLNKKHIDFLAVGDQLYSKLESRSKLWPKGSFSFFQSNLKKKLNLSENYYTPQNFYGKKYFRWGYQFQETPILLRKDHIQDKGFNERQSTVLSRHKRGLGFMISSPSIIVSLLILILSGALFTLYRLMIFISYKQKWALLIFPIIMSPFWFHGLMSNINFWTNLNNETDPPYEIKILKYHKSARETNTELVNEILQGSISDDMRIGMWQVSNLGKSYPTNTPENKTKIESWLSKIIQDFDKFPFNFRYKIIEAVAHIPKLYPNIDAVCRHETHPYVRWYAEDCGFGLKLTKK